MNNNLLEEDQNYWETSVREFYDRIVFGVGISLSIASATKMFERNLLNLKGLKPKWNRVKKAIKLSFSKP